MAVREHDRDRSDRPDNSRWRQHRRDPSSAVIVDDGSRILSTSVSWSARSAWTGFIDRRQLRSEEIGAQPVVGGLHAPALGRFDQMPAGASPEVSHLSASGLGLDRCVERDDVVSSLIDQFEPALLIQSLEGPFAPAGGRRDRS